VLSFLRWACPEFIEGFNGLYFMVYYLFLYSVNLKVSCLPDKTTRGLCPNRAKLKLSYQWQLFNLNVVFINNIVIFVFHNNCINSISKIEFPWYFIINNFNNICWYSIIFKFMMPVC